MSNKVRLGKRERQARKRQRRSTIVICGSVQGTFKVGHKKSEILMRGFLNNTLKNKLVADKEILLTPCTSVSAVGE
jgi:hypothetical protein